MPPPPPRLAQHNVSVSFFMYTDRAIDHSWFRSCPTFRALRASSQNDNLGEVGLRQSLRSSARRVLDPAQAQIFYVPVFEFASAHMGECNGTTHKTRMNAAADALSASRWYQRHQGQDHIFASTAWSFGHATSMGYRMGRLGRVLRNAIVGRYKGGASLPQQSRVGAWPCRLDRRRHTPPHPAARR